MKAIVAADKNWGIGYKNNLLYRIPEDMRFFRKETINKVVIMGYNTFASLPNSQPLKNRLNIVLSRKENLRIENTVVCSSIKQVFRAIEKYDKDDVYIIGGAEVYRAFLKYCDTAIITKIDSDKKADVFFPNLDKEDGWHIAEKSQDLEDNGIKYSRLIYKNKDAEDFGAKGFAAAAEKCFGWMKRVQKNEN